MLIDETYEGQRRLRIQWAPLRCIPFHRFGLKSPPGTRVTCRGLGVDNSWCMVHGSLWRKALFAGEV